MGFSSSSSSSSSSSNNGNGEEEDFEFQSTQERDKQNKRKKKGPKKYGRRHGKKSVKGEDEDDDDYQFQISKTPRQKRKRRISPITKTTKKRNFNNNTSNRPLLEDDDDDDDDDDDKFDIVDSETKATKYKESGEHQDAQGKMSMKKRQQKQHLSLKRKDKKISRTSSPLAASTRYNLSSLPSPSSSSTSSSSSSLPVCKEQKDATKALHLPTNLNHPNLLKWHKRFSPGASSPMYYPCRIIPPKPATKSLNDNFHFSSSSSSSSSSDNGHGSSDSDDEEVQIEYISNLHQCNRIKSTSTTSSSKSNTKFKWISKKRLIPYHGRQNEQELDYNDIVSLTWSKDIYDIYKVQGKNQHNRRMHVMPYSYSRDENNVVAWKHLNEILEVTKNCAGYVTLNNNNNDGDKENSSRKISSKSFGNIDENINEQSLTSSQIDELEEPYTQAIDHKALGLNESDVEMEEFFNDLTKRSSPSSTNLGNSHTVGQNKKEPVHPGDVIEYFHPLFVFGNERGKRVTTIISVDPRKKSFPLTLSNDETLPSDVKVRRIKILVEDHTNKKRQIDHPGIFREIKDFKLVKLNPIPGLQITTERERVKGILQKNMKEFRKKVKTTGFAPLDLMYDFGIKKDDSDFDSGTDDDLSNTKKHNRKPSTIKTTGSSIQSHVSSPDSDSETMNTVANRGKSSNSRHHVALDSSALKRKVSETDSPNLLPACGHSSEGSSDTDTDTDILLQAKSRPRSSTTRKTSSASFRSNAPEAYEEGDRKLLSLRDTDDEGGDDYVISDPLNSVKPGCYSTCKKDVFKSLSLDDDDDSDDEFDDLINPSRIGYRSIPEKEINSHEKPACGQSKDKRIEKKIHTNMSSTVSSKPVQSDCDKDLSETEVPSDFSEDADEDSIESVSQSELKNPKPAFSRTDQTRTCVNTRTLVKPLLFKLQKYN